ncbi:MAG TPA: hypothetical protein VK524_05540 [Polyangiaceae bacterium]|nr:hypothetical protein [Polyangiaceae bacterium]
MSKLFGRYVLRTDGKLMLEGPAETPIVDDKTGLPLTDVKEVQDGNFHGCAVLGTARTASCWRTAANGNASSQLGDGTANATGPLYRATPVLTAAAQPLTDVVSVSSGSAWPFTKTGCAVRQDGTLYCWGDLTWIRNNGIPFISAYAVQITTDGVTPFTKVLQVAVAAEGSTSYACALVQGSSAKEIWCWGNNNAEQLGLGDKNKRQYPTKVLGFANPSKIVLSDRTACAIDGTSVRCWGYNNGGDAGVGSKSPNVHSPTLVVVMGGSTALGEVVDIAPGRGNGGDNFCALRSDNSAWCWGISFKEYASANGIANIVGVGAADEPRFLTSDGVYHIGSTTRSPKCGVL